MPKPEGDYRRKARLLDEGEIGDDVREIVTQPAAEPTPSPLNETPRRRPTDRQSAPTYRPLLPELREGLNVAGDILLEKATALAIRISPYIDKFPDPINAAMDWIEDRLYPNDPRPQPTATSRRPLPTRQGSTQRTEEAQVFDFGDLPSGEATTPRRRPTANRQLNLEAQTADIQVDGGPAEQGWLATTVSQALGRVRDSITERQADEDAYQAYRRGEGPDYINGDQYLRWGERLNREALRRYGKGYFTFDAVGSEQMIAKINNRSIPLQERRLHLAALKQLYTEHGLLPESMIRLIDEEMIADANRNLAKWIQDKTGQEPRLAEPGEPTGPQDAVGYISGDHIVYYEKDDATRIEGAMAARQHYQAWQDVRKREQER